MPNQLEKPKIIREESLYQGFMTLTEATLQYQDGSVHSRLSVDRNDAVAVLVFDRAAKKYLLARQYRYPTAKRGEPIMIEVPAGMIEKGETPAEAAHREILEEMGCKMETLTSLGAFWSSPGLITERIHLFYGETGAGLYATEGGGTDPGEDIEVVRMSQSELDEFIGSATCIDAKLWICYLRTNQIQNG